jgi:phage host-nuclease inhibitor protein Gam
MEETLIEILHWFKSTATLPDAKYYFWHTGLSTRLIVGGVEVKDLPKAFNIVYSKFFAEDCRDLIKDHSEKIFFYFVEELGALSGIEVSAKELLSMENNIFFQAKKIKSESEEFRIDDIKSLEWYLRKVRETELEIETIKTQSAAMLKEVETSLERLKERFSVQAEAFARSQIDFSKSKNLKTFQGTVQFKSLAASIKVYDKTLVPKEFFKEKISLELDNSKLKEAILKDGENIEGVEAVPACEKMYLQFGGKE